LLRKVLEFLRREEIGRQALGLMRALANGFLFPIGHGADEKLVSPFLDDCQFIQTLPQKVAYHSRCHISASARDLFEVVCMHGYCSQPGHLPQQANHCWRGIGPSRSLNIPEFPGRQAGRHSVFFFIAPWDTTVLIHSSLALSKPVHN